MFLLNIVRSRLLYSYQAVQDPVLPPYVEGVFESERGGQLQKPSFDVEKSYQPPQDQDMSLGEEDITTATSNNLLTNEQPSTEHQTNSNIEDLETTTETQLQTTENIEKIIFTSAPFDDVTFRDDTIFFESIAREERGDDVFKDESFLPYPILENYNVLVIPDHEVHGTAELELEPRFIDDGYLPHVDNSLKHPISYSYNYAVDDGPQGPQFSKQEASDGVLTKGEYSVMLPDGRLQTVSYSVTGQGGFSVNVKYKNQYDDLQDSIAGHHSDLF